jgi:hypothetical protein
MDIDTKQQMDMAFLPFECLSTFQARGFDQAAG